MAYAGSDTVLLVKTIDDVRLVWLSAAGSDRNYWISRPLYGGKPDVDLGLVDEDSLQDLFWRLAYEEIVGGMLLVGRQGSPIEAASTTDACRVPVLEDVTRDGLLDFIEYRPGALSLDECFGDPLALACQEEFPTEWVIVLVQTSEGFEDRPSLARDFYRLQADRYSSAAVDLRTKLSEDSVSVPSPRCNELMVGDLERMAAEARGRAGL